MDIRLVRGRNHRIWLWTAVLVGLSLLALLTAYVFGDATEATRIANVGASSTFGADRAPVLPVEVDGYLSKLSRTEFDVWMDTLRFAVPRPKPGVKFGDLPDSNFARIDSLFIKDFYLSVRPEGIHPGRGGARVAASTPA